MDSTNYVVVSVDTSSPAHSGTRAYGTAIGSMSTSSYDTVFRIYSTPVEEQTEDDYTTTSGGDLILGDTVTARGQVFQASSSRNLSSVEFEMGIAGSPTGTVVAKLYAITGTPNSDAVPTGSALATSDTIDASNITDTWWRFVFNGSNKYTMTQNTWYAIVLEYTGDSSNNLRVEADNTTPTHGGNAVKYESSAWGAQSRDLSFAVYSIASSGYTIEATSGSFALAGTAGTEMLVARKITTQNTAFTLAGTAGTQLLADRVIVPGPGVFFAFPTSGTEMLVARKITTQNTAFTLAGQDIEMTHSALTHYTMTLESGTFSVAGQDINLLKASVIDVDSGAFIG
jgi:hypothetical protein